MSIRKFVLAAAMALPGAATYAQDTLRPVKVQAIEAGQTQFERQFFGQVVARQSVDLAFQVSGQIVELPILEGQTVPAGGLIAQLDLETFQLTLDQARLQKEQADRTVERLAQLSGSTVSQVTRDDAETQASLAAIAVRNAEYALEHATLHAPFDALVATRNVPNFATVGAGSPIVRLHDMSELRIDIDVPEVLFQQAGQEGGDVQVSAVFPASDQVFPLEIREFNAESSSVGQTFRITFGMTPPEGLNILPGSSVTVHVGMPAGIEGIEVPNAALLPQTDGSVRVMVFTPENDDSDVGQVRVVPVEVDVRPDGEIYIKSGLETGDEIVVAGAQALNDGDTVRRFTGFPN